MSAPVTRAALLRLFRTAWTAWHHGCGVGRCWLCLLGFGFAAQAAAPVLEHLYPAGGGRGSSNEVVLSGKWDPWPPKIWVEGSGVAVSATTNTGRVRVDIAPDAEPGVRWVRLYNEYGASDPRLFVVGEFAELADAEPNNTFMAAQRVGSLPATVNGRLDKNGDVDSFGVTLGDGEWLEARLDAYTLLSTLDGVLRVVSTNGQPLAWNHDFVTLDPRVVWQSSVAQTVVVQVYGFKYPADASIRLTGGAGAVYRLHLATHGECPDGVALERVDEGVAELPARLRGVVVGEGTEVRHRFRAMKEDLLSIRLAAAALGAPWDARLRIVDGVGKELAQNDDAEGGFDPRLDWRAPVDGEYSVGVASRTRRGSAQHRYELTIAKAVPDYRATVGASGWALAAGATQEVTVAVARLHGHTNELTVAFADLPEGVSSEPVMAPTGKGEVVLRLVAATNAPSQGVPIRIRVSPAVGSESRWVPNELVSRGENNGVPQGYSRLLRDGIETLWLTVRPAEQPAK